MGTVIEQTELPESLEPPDNLEDETSEEAPYGYKKDGTPRKAPGRKPGSGGTGGGSSRGKIDKELLTTRLVEYFGGPLILVSPVAAAVWEDRAERTADAIIVLASRSVRWRKWVERLLTGSAAGDLGITIVGVGTGLLVDTGRLAPDGKVASYYNIPEIYTDLYGAFESSRNGNGAEERGLFAEVS
jgi:hypothetical protein